MDYSNRTIFGAGMIAAVVAIAVIVIISLVLFDDDAPAPVSLREAVASLETPRESSTGESPQEAAEAQPEIWEIAPGTDTFVGYRIGEELATIGTTEAVGRTSDVTASVQISGSQVVAASFEANMTTLTSDDSRRDDTLRSRGLETAVFPTAFFELTQSIELGTAPVDRAIYSVIAVGELTLHGATQSVEIPLEAQYVDNAFVIVGSIEIELADYNIVAPTTRIALSVSDHGTIEMQFILTPAV